MKKLFLALSVLGLLGATSAQAWHYRYYRGGYYAPAYYSCDTCYSPVYYRSGCCW